MGNWTGTNPTRARRKVVLSDGGRGNFASLRRCSNRRSTVQSAPVWPGLCSAHAGDKLANFVCELIRLPRECISGFQHLAGYASTPMRRRHHDCRFARLVARSPATTARSPSTRHARTGHRASCSTCQARSDRARSLQGCYGRPAIGAGRNARTGMKVPSISTHLARIDE